MSSLSISRGQIVRLAVPAIFAVTAACTASGPRAPESGGASADGAAAAETVPEPVRREHEAALAALEAGNAAEAERLLQALVEAHPEYPGAHVNLAIVYREDGRDDAARAALEAALEADPDHPQANNELGIVLRRAGEFEAAEQAYRRALEADPDYALAHHNLGVLLDLYLHRPAEALEHYERYQALVAEPDRTVAGWIIDLRRRVGASEADAARVAREDGT